LFDRLGDLIGFAEPDRAYAHLTEEIGGIRYFEVLQNVRSNQVLMDCVSAAFGRSPIPLRYVADLFGRLRRKPSHMGPNPHLYPD
jgi:hypothetical protein